MKTIVKFASLAVLTLCLAGVGSAQVKKSGKPAPAPAKAAAKAPAKPATCPVCHMPLSAKKTKTDTVAVQLKKGDKVMYCCAGCKMPASVLVKGK